MNTEKIKLILPKNSIVLDLQKTERLYFLAGPISGADDWQAKAIKMLHSKDPGCYIVCPSRYDESHELMKYSMIPTESMEGELSFPNQTMWERHYLELASWYGSIIFWLPCEDSANPRAKEDGPYARDTYGELGRWSIRSGRKIIPLDYFLHTPLEWRVNLTVGAEKNFHGLSVIQKNLDGDHRQPFQIYSSLEDTISAAVKLAKVKNS